MGGGGGAHPRFACRRGSTDFGLTACGVGARVSPAPLFGEAGQQITQAFGFARERAHAIPRAPAFGVGPPLHVAIRGDQFHQAPAFTFEPGGLGVESLAPRRLLAPSLGECRELVFETPGPRPDRRNHRAQQDRAAHDVARRQRFGDQCGRRTPGQAFDRGQHPGVLRAPAEKPAADRLFFPDQVRELGLEARKLGLVVLDCLGRGHRFAARVLQLVRERAGLAFQRVGLAAPRLERPFHLVQAIADGPVIGGRDRLTHGNRQGHDDNARGEGGPPARTIARRRSQRPFLRSVAGPTSPTASQAP